MKLRILLVTVSVLISLLGIGQKGKLIVHVKPDTAIVKLDGNKITPSIDPFVTDTGIHVIECWAPTLKYYKRTVTVDVNQTKVVGIAMTYTDEYNAYRKNMRLYKLNSTVYKTGFIYAIGVTTVYSGIRMALYDRKINEAYDNAVLAKSEYDMSTTSFSATKYASEFESYKTTYDELLKKRNTTVVVAGSMDLVFGLLHMYFRKKRSTMVKPSYQEVPLLANLDIVPVYQMNGLGLSLKYSL